MSAPSRKEAFSIQLILLLDAGLIWLAFWLASVLRTPLFDFLQQIASRMGFAMAKETIRGLSDITWVLFIAVPFTPMVLEMFGFYENPLHRHFSQSFSRVMKSFTVVGCAILAFAVAFKLSTSSRLVLGTAVVLSMTFIILRDEAVARYYQRRARRGIGLENMALAGNLLDISALLNDLDETVKAYWNIVGKFDIASGDWEGFRKMLNDGAVERVIFAVNRSDFGQVSEAIEICENQGIEAWVAANFLRTRIARPTFDLIGNQPMLVLRSTPELSWSLLAKGAIDHVGAILLLVATLWLWPIVWVGIKLQSPGPVLFRQMRAGRYGKPFSLLKFRSMVVNAEHKLDEVKRTSGNEMSAPAFKLEKDPRTFRFGRFIRRFSIDELPQLINVLRGDMSLVGPRPLPVYEVEAIEKSTHRRRMSMKPGITCIWQISGRNQITDFDDWVKLDLEYIDHWSLWLDLKLLFKTAATVLFGHGAR